MIRWTGVILVTLLMCSLGCSPETVESAKRDFNRDTATVQKSAKQIEEVTKPVMVIAKPLTDVVKKEADKRVEQLKIGARVTAVLKANENLPQTIRVDAAPDAQRVTLRGTVKTIGQKKLAGRIAKQTIGQGKTVQNDLVIESK